MSRRKHPRSRSPTWIAWAHCAYYAMAVPKCCASGAVAPPPSSPNAKQGCDACDDDPFSFPFNWLFITITLEAEPLFSLLFTLFPRKKLLLKNHSELSMKSVDQLRSGLYFQSKIRCSQICKHKSRRINRCQNIIIRLRKKNFTSVKLTKNCRL